MEGDKDLFDALGFRIIQPGLQLLHLFFISRPGSATLMVVIWTELSSFAPRNV